MSRASTTPLVVIVFVWLAATALGLGTTSLAEPDEPRFAEATRQMLLRGDILTPYFNGAPRFEKPILFYWMQLPAFVALRATETAARLPSALAGLGCLLLTYAIGRRYFSRRAALSAALVLATTFRFAVWTRLGLTDVPVLLWMLAALYGFLSALEDEPPRRRWALTGWMAIGLGALTKGPVIVIPFVILGIYIAWTRQQMTVHRLCIWCGASIALAIALPWYLWMSWRHGHAFLDFALGYEVIARYGYGATQFPSPPRGFAWYLQVYPGDALPWTLFVVAAVIWSALEWRTFDERTRRGVTLVAIWFLTVFAVFSSARYKLPHYILPAYPAAALLTGLFVDHAVRRQSPGWLWRIPLAATSLGVVGLAGVLAVFLHRVFGTAWTDVGMLLPCAIGAAGIAMLVFDVMERRAAAFHAFAAGLAIVTAFVALYTAPHDLQRYQPIRTLGQHIASLAGADDRVAIYGRMGGPGLIFYARRDIEWVDDPAHASTFLGGPGRRFCVIPEPAFDLVRRMHPAPLSVIDRGAFFNVRLKRLFEPNPRIDERELLLVSNMP